jgi:hypothetical protein
VSLENSNGETEKVCPHRNSKNTSIIYGSKAYLDIFEYLLYSKNNILS